METREKKFFSPVLKSYNYDLAERWRIEWYIPVYNGLASKRIVRYGRINEGITVEERLKYADNLIKSLNLESPIKIKNNVLDKVIELSTINWRQKTIEAYTTVVNSFKIFLDNRDPEKINEEMIHHYC